MPIIVSEEKLDHIPFDLLPIRLRILNCPSMDIGPVIYSKYNQGELFLITDIICRGQCDNPKCLLKQVTAV